MICYQESFEFDKYDLPYESLDYDFDSIKQYLKTDDDQPTLGKDGSIKERRCNYFKIFNIHLESFESIQTETVKDGKSAFKSARSHSIAKEVFDGEINYKEILGSINQSNPYGFRRLKPWENYKIYSNKNDGLIAALSNQDLDRVSSIYNA